MRMNFFIMQQEQGQRRLPGASANRSGGVLIIGKRDRTAGSRSLRSLVRWLAHHAIRAKYMPAASAATPSSRANQPDIEARLLRSKREPATVCKKPSTTKTSQLRCGPMINVTIASAGNERTHSRSAGKCAGRALRSLIALPSNENSAGKSRL